MPGTRGFLITLCVLTFWLAGAADDHTNSLAAQQPVTKCESLQEFNDRTSLKRAAVSKQAVDLADQGLGLILNKRFLPPDFDQETFDEIWKSWPADLANSARDGSVDARRQMMFRRYGFTPRKDEPLKPLQFVVDGQNNWAMNCFACHGGSLYDSKESYPGLPNNRLALETLYEDMRNTKRILKKPFSSMDVGSALVPMGSTVGTSNAVIFGVALMAFRDKDLNLKSFVVPPYVMHHDMDAPPWWNYKHRRMIYIDGFLEKHHRALMPFIMVKQNDGPKFRSFEQDFVAIGKFIESVQPPKYVGRIDRDKVALGRIVFRDNCATCHGTYEPELRYPEKTIDLAEIKTDPVRLSALSVSYRKRYGKSWLADYGKVKTISEPAGYVAPPLIGIWASAPYLHNGSVPTLRALLDPRLRPKIWTRKKPGFNEKEVGLIVESVARIPTGISNAKRRHFFDTSKYGKSNSGHEFGEHLDRTKQDQLLEYLKTL